MALQKDCGTIIIDALLTDVGRQKLARGDFQITAFGLGDDEINYEIGNSSTGTWMLTYDAPIFEATGKGAPSIRYGLMNLNNRSDILYLPRLYTNEKIPGAVNLVTGSMKYWIAANSETTLKLQQQSGSNYVLENNESLRNFILVESMILQSPTSTLVDDTAAYKERYLTNLDLLDEYMFIYADGRFIDNLLINGKDAVLKNDIGNNLYSTILPLEKAVKVSIDSGLEYYETYKARAIDNDIFNDNDLSHTDHVGCHGSALAFNFQLNQRLGESSSSLPDERYTSFGTTGAPLFGSDDKYDYIDTNVLLEGASSAAQLVVPLRIVRYAGK